jgi:hypothetical protein
MNKDLRGSLAWGVGIIAVALVATFARRIGYVDGDTVTRIVLGVIGLSVAWFGNRMPKAFIPSDAARQVTRVAGWSLALSGIVYAVLWAFAPFSVALAVGCGAILGGMLVTIGYCLSMRARTRTG